jgi:hypothetical protein
VYRIAAKDATNQSSAAVDTGTMKTPDRVLQFTVTKPG